MQNVNLYQYQRERRSGPRPAQLLAGLALLALLMLLHGLWEGWRWHQAEQRAAAAQLAAEAAQAELEQMRANFREPVLDPSLGPRLAAREQLNARLQELVDHLAQAERDQQEGFLALLAALADRHPEAGLWLTRIRLQEGGRELRLDGLTTDQELLPRYLERLGGSEQFSARQFARLDVQRAEPDLLRFELSSTPQEEGDDE